MKKAFICVLAACALASCGYKTPGQKAAEASLDSLQRVYNLKENEAAELLSIINEVEENFTKIKEAEDYISTESQDENVTDDVKARLNNNFELVKNLIQENKDKVAELEKKLANTQGQLGGLRATINRLKADVEEKTQVIESLKADVAQRDIKIQELDSTVVVLNDNINTLNTLKTEAEGVISEQDAELHKAYYYIGNNKQLKEDNIIIKSGTYNKKKFTEVDIREVSSIPLNSKVGVLLSHHPFGSYRMNVGSDKQVTLVITNADEFWSLSKYLIVRVK